LHSFIMVWMSCINLYFPLAFFSSIKIGLFHGLLEGSTCPAFICCCTKIWACCNFCPESGHWSAHIDSLINHLCGIAVGQDFISVAPRRGGGYKYNQSHSDRKNIGKGPLPKVLWLSYLVELGKGPPPRPYDCPILLILGKSLLPRLSFVCGKSHAQLLHYVSPP
jgi:hypothetical protein